MQVHPVKTLGTPRDRFACMALVRAFEEKIEALFSRGLIGGTSHLCIGQEASAVGAVSAIGVHDGVVSSHRGHGHFLAKGADLNALMAELLGKSTGTCRGRGGSQHLFDPAIGFYGTNGITGGGIPVATGVALSARLRATGGVVLCFFGDGATNQGTFHEALNMASLWKLPIVYICENNQYAMSTPLSKSMAVKQIADRAAAYAMPAVRTDGMDVEIVRNTVAEAVARARAGDGPTLVEALCYRFCGHSKSDRRVYRTRQEEETWRARDPLLIARRHLSEAGLSRDELDAIEAQARQDVEAAYEAAASAPDPTRDDVITSPYF